MIDEKLRKFYYNISRNIESIYDFKEIRPVGIKLNFFCGDENFLTGLELEVGTEGEGSYHFLLKMEGPEIKEFKSPESNEGKRTLLKILGVNKIPPNQLKLESIPWQVKGEIINPILKSLNQT